MSKYTAGPWKYTAWGQTVSIDSSNYIGIAHVNPNGSHNIGIPSREDIANARLIAAAPELLEALKASLHDINELKRALADEIGSNRASIYYQLGSAARAAIQKAEE